MLTLLISLGLAWRRRRKLAVYQYVPGGKIHTSETHIWPDFWSKLCMRIPSTDMGLAAQGQRLVIYGRL